MNWKEQLASYEMDKDWLKAIDLLIDQINLDGNESEPYVRIIYLLHNLLLEEDYKRSGLDHDHLANLLLTYFQESKQKFNDDPEYLFFIGTILHVAEWYFGQNSEELALDMQKRAYEAAPENILYGFSYYFSVGDRNLAKQFARRIISNSSILSWLDSKGFPGKYKLQIIEAVEDGRI